MTLLVNGKRRLLINKFIDLNIGDLEDVYTMPLDILETMIDDLKQAQDNGNLDLETSQGIENLQRIVNTYA
jgi:hypothetical protein